ncbi:MAG: hypothetical protein IJ087_19710 [Eggerthellaceae bacterium]|nr:hypothetical protein [Eggerthellaceae bacterium]
MATKIRFEMNHDGWREILCSQKMADACNAVGERIASEAGQDFAYFPATLSYGGGRVGGFVRAQSIEGMLAEATGKVLTKAVHA